MLQFLRELHPIEAFALFLAENFLIVVLTVLLSYGLSHGFAFGGFFQTLRRTSLREIGYTSLSILINSLITYAGYECWMRGWIHFNEAFSYRIVTDSLVLIFAMDAVMFFLHWVVHRTFLYKIVHTLHHEYTHPQAIDLFVLHPLETLSFGSLWVLLLLVFPANIYAVVIYLTLNVTFGMLGHMEVELFPKNWLRLPVLRFVATATFHYQHHAQEQYNFGFYTTLWDSLFGTLAPDYQQQFERSSAKADDKKSKVG